MMQVLIALHKGMGETVSRDQLSLLCWEGRVVGDDALNRIISRLRKALSPDPAVAIDTIPKVGYRLRVGDDHESARPHPTRIPSGVFIVGGAALSILLAALVVGEGREVRWSAEDMRPLTRDSGIEIYPALSPDGRELAYAGATSFAEATDLYLLGTTLGETRPVRLTATAEAAEVSPAWSPDGGQLAFVRQAENRPCEIVVITPPNSSERNVGGCQEASTTMINWLDSRTILYSDGPADGPWRLFALDVDSGQARPITSPGPRLLGDSAPVPSPDGSRIAFRRSSTPGNDDIVLLDWKSGDTRTLGLGGWKAISFAWGPDSRTLLWTSNRGGDFGLWAVDARRPARPQRISYGIVGLGRMSADRNGNLAIETVRTRANLFALSADREESPLTTAGGNDWEPDFAPNGSMVFVSDVSGSAEIWVKRSDEQPERLTQLRGGYVYSPRWSPDGRRIAFIAVNQGRNEVYTIGGDGSRLRKLTDDGINKGSLVWSSSSELLYTAEYSAGWRVIRLRENERPVEVAGSEGLLILRRASDRALFGRGLEPQIMRLRYGNGQMVKEATGISAPIAEAWRPSLQGIYWVERAQGPATVRFSPWNGPSRELGRLQSLHRPTLALRPSDGALVAPRLTEGSADLILFELKKE